MKIDEIRGKTEDQLVDKLLELKKEALNFRFQKSTGELQKTHRVTEVLKLIAKIKTVLAEKKLAGATHA